MHYYLSNATELSDDKKATTISFTLVTGSSNTDLVIKCGTIRTYGYKFRLGGFNTLDKS